MNLRAALFRALGELKKNGVLGKEIMLRKTMLDDCRGDKFEEVLAKFALIVLRKFSKETLPPATALIVEDRDRRLDQEALLPLIIAHQKGLKKLVAAKTEQEQRLAKFEQMLDAEAKALKLTDGRPSIRRQSSIEAVRNRAEDAKQRLEQAWTGDEAWVDILVNGGSEKSTPNLSKTNFEDVWDSVHHETHISLKSTTSRSLLDDLNDKIVQQEKRLSDWRAFKERVAPGNSQKKDVRTVASSRPSQIPFSDHQVLQFDPHKIQKPIKSPTIPFNDPCGDLVERMQSSLAALKGGGWKEPVNYNALDNDETLHSRNADPVRTDLHFSQDRGEAKHRPKRNGIDRLQENINPLSKPPELSAVSNENSSSTKDRGQSRQPASVPQTVTKDTRDLPLSYNQQPQHPQPGRTGYSLVRALSPLAEDKTLEPESPPPDLPLPPEQSRRTTIPVSTLIERTRQSMSFLPNNPPKPTSSKHHSRKSTQPRPSQTFPVNQFETPPRGLRGRSPQLSSSGSSTPRDSLFSEDAEYASVFKSRPRIALSPNFSPERSGLGEDAMNEEEVDDDAALLVAGLGDMGLNSSPSRDRNRS